MENRNGFTLVEVLLAMIILTLVLVSSARFAVDFSRSMGDASVRVIAMGVATDRLELVRADPRYERLRTLYGTGSGADTTGFPGYATMHRLTTVARDTTAGRDRTTVTVRVTAPPGFRDTVAVTAVIARP
jgi:prepilin-type N-terminal cleavage/methylation domain-containing protein